MKILAFDTSTEACVVGVLVDGEIIEHFSIPEQKHTLILLPIIEDLLQHAGITLSELDAIAYGQGPGAFTGVRLAVSVAQGLGYSSNVPVIGVSSLASVAQYVNTEHHSRNVLVAMDARMGEVYVGAYKFNDVGEMESQSDEFVGAISEINTPLEGHWIAVGSGWAAYRDDVPDNYSKIISSVITVEHPHASSLIKLSERSITNHQSLSAEQAIPIYLRNNVANKAN